MTGQATVSPWTSVISDGKLGPHAPPETLVVNGVKYTRDNTPEPLTPDTIDWSHVAPEFKWMARGKHEAMYLYTKAPECELTNWVMWGAGKVTRADTFASYRRGTMDWKDSLVQRPEGDQ